MKFANICFLPVCSNCGSVLYGFVIDAGEKNGKEYVNPPSCPACGKPFTNIGIPYRLPFDCPKREELNET